MTTRGILHPRTAEAKFQLTRHPPAADLAFFVMRYWIIRWDLPEPHVQETLPYPCVNLVFEQNKTRVYGVERGKSASRIEGKGQVFGIKFRPGAFYPFYRTPLIGLTDRSLPVGEVFGIDDQPLENAILSLDDDAAAMIALVENFLRAHLPERDENVTLVNQIVDCIVDDRRVVKVDNVVERIGLAKRTLERLFSQYVGVSPKWVIQRYRLHEAAEQLIEHPLADCTQMALALGYFDQAHFIKDFKALIGTTPAEYARSATSLSHD